MRRYIAGTDQIEGVGILERYLFPALLAIVSLNLVVLLLTVSSLTALTKARAAARQATQTNIRLEQVYTGLREAESSQRGYVITGDDSYLEPYKTSVRQMPQLFTGLYAELPPGGQRQKLDQIKNLSESKMAELTQTIGLRRTSGYDAATAIIVTNAGRDTMENAHKLIIQLESQTSANSRQRDATVDRLVVVSYMSLGISLVLTIALVLLLRTLFGQVALRRQYLQTLNAELGRSNRELQDFASVASHDLQEPLRKIQAFGDRLRGSVELPDTSREYLVRMLDAAGRMRILIDDLLAFSRVTTKAQPFARVSLDRTVNDVLSDMEIKIEETGAKVDVGQLPVINADASQMRQLLQNLIGNALKFNRPGVAPEIIIRSTMDESHGRDMVRITVQDNGIGFDTKYLDRIFTIFQRLHGRNEYEGTGIGLAVVRKIAERHQGTVDADSQPGEGATFIVTLPIKPDTIDTKE